MYRHPEQPINILTQRPIKEAKSTALIVFGTLLIACNAFQLVFCISYTIINNISSIVFISGSVFSVYHIINGIFAIVGGSNVIRYKCCAITSLVLGIIGSLIACFLLVFDFIKWAEDYHWHYPLTSHVPVLGSAFMTIALSITLSSVICCHVCSCCCCHTGSSTADHQNPFYPYWYGSPDQINAPYQPNYPSSQLGYYPPHYTTLCNPQQRQSDYPEQPNTSID